MEAASDESDSDIGDVESEDESIQESDADIEVNQNYFFVVKVIV